MRRMPAVGLLVAVVAGVAAGCGTTSGSTPSVPAVVRAPPQSARLGWSEPYPPANPALVFGVSTLTVTRNGWSAEISVENRSDGDWKVGGPRSPAFRSFGVLLFPNDDLDALEQRNRSGDLPAIRGATRYEPSLPRVLRPGQTWKGTISAPGALAGGFWARISFGPFVSDDPPDRVQSPVVWFTDHAYHLDEVEAEPV